jgi:hypothetical protein
VCDRHFSSSVRVSLKDWRLENRLGIHLRVLSPSRASAAPDCNSGRITRYPEVETTGCGGVAMTLPGILSFPLHLRGACRQTCCAASRGAAPLSCAGPPARQPTRGTGFSLCSPRSPCRQTCRAGSPAGGRVVSLTNRVDYFRFADDTAEARTNAGGIRHDLFRTLPHLSMGRYPSRWRSADFAEPAA